MCDKRSFIHFVPQTSISSRSKCKQGFEEWLSEEESLGFWKRGICMFFMEHLQTVMQISFVHEFKIVQIKLAEYLLLYIPAWEKDVWVFIYLLIQSFLIPFYFYHFNLFSFCFITQCNFSFSSSHLDMFFFLYFLLFSVLV